MTVPLYVPDLPALAELSIYLGQIDQSRQYTNFGPLEREFSARMSEWIDPHAPPDVVTFSSGTDALITALRVLQLVPGARVLTPALSFPATVFAIQAAGLTPVLADVDPVEWRLTPKIATRSFGLFDAVLPVAAFGAPMDTAAWDEFSNSTGVPVVIDAAAALLNRPRAHHCATVFSLHATKPFGIGEGGLMVTSDPDLAARARRLSNFGFDGAEIITPSGNAKMSEYHAAVGLAQLARIAGVEARLRGVLALYDELLPPVGRQPGLPANLVIDASQDAQSLAAQLAEAGVETRRWYQPDIAAQPAFRDVAHVGRLEVCRSLRGRLLGLPFHTSLTRAAVLKVTQVIKGMARAPVGRVEDPSTE